MFLIYFGVEVLIFLLPDGFNVQRSPALRASAPPPPSAPTARASCSTLRCPPSWPVCSFSPSLTRLLIFFRKHVPRNFSEADQHFWLSNDKILQPRRFFFRAPNGDKSLFSLSVFFLAKSLDFDQRPLKNLQPKTPIFSTNRLSRIFSIKILFSHFFQEFLPSAFSVALVSHAIKLPAALSHSLPNEMFGPLVTRNTDDFGEIQQAENVRWFMGCEMFVRKCECVNEEVWVWFWTFVEFDFWVYFLIFFCRWPHSRWSPKNNQTQIPIHLVRVLFLNLSNNKKFRCVLELLEKQVI